MRRYIREMELNFGLSLVANERQLCPGDGRKTGGEGRGGESADEKSAQRLSTLSEALLS